MKTPYFLLASAVLLLAACTTPASVTPPDPTQQAGRASAEDAPKATTQTPAPSPTADPVIVPISIYILDSDTGEGNSARTVEELETVLDAAGEIWSQAGIGLDVQSVQRLTVPASVLEAIGQGDFSAFFRAAGAEFDIPDLSLINGFYAPSIGGPNGIAPSSTRTFFVMDEPSVHDERVTAHEIGHILGLHHTLEDQGRLIYPGTNGMSLTEEESVVARYVAQGLIQGMR